MLNQEIRIHNAASIRFLFILQINSKITASHSSFDIVDARSSREVKAGIPCSIGAGWRGFDPRQPPTHEACLLSAVGDLK